MSNPVSQSHDVDAMKAQNRLDRIARIIFDEEASRYRNEACRHVVDQPYADNRYVRLLDDLRDTFRK